MTTSTLPYTGPDFNNRIFMEEIPDPREAWCHRQRFRAQPPEVMQGVRAGQGSPLYSFSADALPRKLPTLHGLAGHVSLWPRAIPRNLHGPGTLQRSLLLGGQLDPVGTPKGVASTTAILVANSRQKKTSYSDSPRTSAKHSLTGPPNNYHLLVFFLNYRCYKKIPKQNISQMPRSRV